MSLRGPGAELEGEGGCLNTSVPVWIWSRAPARRGLITCCMQLGTEWDDRWTIEKSTRSPLAVLKSAGLVHSRPSSATLLLVHKCHARAMFRTIHLTCPPIHKQPIFTIQMRVPQQKQSLTELFFLKNKSWYPMSFFITQTRFHTIHWHRDPEKYRVNVRISDPSLFATLPYLANMTWSGASKWL